MSHPSWSLGLLLIAAGLVIGCHSSRQDSTPPSGNEGEAEAGLTADEVERVEPAAAHAQFQAGEALLVCAYDDEQRCRELGLEGSLTLPEFEAQLSELDRDQRLIFFCA